ncbi:MAG: sulfite exporter TauE/SafE family protein [Prosthecobacter sp.]|nr:sulfite exporter TauE/SafE family protein [Prosthecobacter sp.]
MSLSTILTCLAIGIVGGVIAALCGVGGGVVMVPAFVFLLAMPQKMAVATSLAVIIPTAIMATTQNAKNDFVSWKVAIVTALSASLFAYFGAGWLKSMSNETLTRIFGCVLLIFGVRMLLQGKA